MTALEMLLQSHALKHAVKRAFVEDGGNLVVTLQDHAGRPMVSVHVLDSPDDSVFFEVSRGGLSVVDVSDGFLPSVEEAKRVVSALLSKQLPMNGQG